MKVGVAVDVGGFVGVKVWVAVFVGVIVGGSPCKVKVPLTLNSAPIKIRTSYCPGSQA